MNTDSRTDHSQTKDDIALDLAEMAEDSAQPSDGLADLASWRSTDDKLWVSSDGLVARLWRVDAEITREDIDRILADRGIVEGIDEQGINQALAVAQRGQVQHGLVVARGRALQRITAARVIYHPGLEESVEREMNWQDVLQADELTTHGLENFEVVAVPADTSLAEWYRGQFNPGSTVRGESIFPKSQGAQAFRIGRGVTVSDDGRQCLSQHYGYVTLNGASLQVVPPLWIAPDRSETHYVHLPHQFVELPPSEEDLLQILRLAGIEHGIDSQAIKTVCQRIGNDHRAPFTLCIARSLLAEERGEVDIRYAFDPLHALSWDQMQALYNSDNLVEFRKSMEWLLQDSGLRCPLLRPGDLIAEKIGPDDGRDDGVFWEVGSGIQIQPDGMSVVASQWGFPVLRGGRIEIVSPLWVVPDASAAYFVNLPQGDGADYPSPQDMAELLAIAEVKHGYNERDWEDSLRALVSGQHMPALLPVALSTPPQQGAEDAFQWAINVEENRVGKILEDGSIDFRERSRAPSVREGDLIGTFIPARRVTPGCDVLGREIPVPRSHMLEVLCGPKVREDKDGDQILFYAEEGGEVIVEDRVMTQHHRTRRRLRLSISQVINVDGDVGYGTGNIDFSGDVVIRGSVQSLFSVRAEGSVHISGYIEDGAVVTAGKDIMVGGGIIGATTQIEAGGSLWAKFAQEASIRVGGDVRMGSYLFNASLRAGGKVVVLGRGEGKSRALVGGLVWSGSGIETLSVGSPYNSATHLVCGVDYRQVEHLERLRNQHRTCEERMQELMDKLGMPNLDMQQFRQQLQRRTTEKNRREIAAGVRRLVRLNNRRQSLMEDIEEVISAQRSLARSARIAVRGTVYSGVDMRIGEISTSFKEEHSFQEIRLVEKDGVLSIVERPLERRAPSKG